MISFIPSLKSDMFLSRKALLYAVDLLLAYRALCLYRMNRRLVIFNVILFCLCAATSAVLLGLAYSNFKAVDTPKYLYGCWSLVGSFVALSHFPGESFPSLCFRRQPSTAYVDGSLIGLLFELWLCGLVVYRVISTSKSGRLWSRKSVVELVVSDCIGWFIM